MKNILIVEDSATYRELLCKVLKGKGYKVAESSTINIFR